jgi:TPR repeat protein
MFALSACEPHGVDPYYETQLVDWAPCFPSNRAGHSQAEVRHACEQLCAWHEPRGCDNLAAELIDHGSTPADTSRARDLFEQKCWTFPSACTDAGQLSQYAPGVKQDAARAREFYARGCNGNDADACGNLGWLWEHGHGGGVDASHAAALYDRACSGGAARWCFELAWQLDRGSVDDRMRARELFHRACELGWTAGC